MADYSKDTYTRLVGRLGEQSARALKYYELTETIAGLLSAGEMEKLVGVLDERGRVIAELVEQSGALQAAAGAHGALSGEGEAGALIEKTQECLEAARELDLKNMEALRSLMDDTSGEGKKITKSREGIGKYAQKDLILSPGFFDRKQ